MTTFFESINEQRAKQVQAQMQQVQQQQQHQAQVDTTKKVLLELKQKNLEKVKADFENAVASLKMHTSSPEWQSLVLADPINELINKSSIIVKAYNNYNSVERIEDLTNIINWIDSSLKGKPIQNTEMLDILSKELNRENWLDKKSNRVMFRVGLLVSTIVLAVVLAPYLWHVGIILTANALAEGKFLLGTGCYMASVVAYSAAFATAVAAVASIIYDRPQSVAAETKILTKFFDFNETASGAEYQENEVQVTQDDKEYSMSASSY